MRVISLSRSGSLRGFSGSEQWIAWLCPNGFGGSIFMDWVAPPPWNTQSYPISIMTNQNKDLSLKQ